MDHGKLTRRTLLAASAAAAPLLIVARRSEAQVVAPLPPSPPTTPWVEELPLGLALVAGHLGLLLWEARSVSASLAFPALKPGTLKESA